MKTNRKTNILFLSWRDIKSPQMGGAEIFTHEMLKRVDKRKFSITHLSPKFKGCLPEENIDGVKYIRWGNVFSVILYAFIYYLIHRNHIDYVVDQCNEHRFFTPFWVSRKRRIFFIHHIGKEQWLRNLSFPFGHMGYYSEGWMTKLYKRNYTLTVSESTKSELVALGFKSNLVKILPEGINFEPWKREDFLEKEKEVTFTYVGRFVKHKGIDSAIEAFGRLKTHYPESKFWIIGRENIGFKESVLLPVCKKYGLVEGVDVVFHGFVTDEKKLELMSRSHAIVFPSEREGWGLPVTESAVVGTPSVVFNSPGLRDAVNFGQAGFITTRNTPEELKELMIESIEDKGLYDGVRETAYEFSRKFHWSKTAQVFEAEMENIQKEAQR